MKDKPPAIYKWIKIGGVLLYVPIALAAGPLLGFVIGGFLTVRFNAGPYVFWACITAGFAASAIETARIIKFALKAEEENGNE